jgi:hypothetical protein
VVVVANGGKVSLAGVVEAAWMMRVRVLVEVRPVLSMAT